MRDFGVRYFNEINFVTDWMTDTQEGLDLLRDKTKIIAQDFLKFLSITDKDIEGVHINYYHLDSDTFAEGDDVVKWSVTLSPRYKSGFTEELNGHHPALKYQVVDAKTHDPIFKSDFIGCIKYVEEAFPEYNIETEEGAQEMSKHMLIEEYEEEYLKLTEEK